MELRIQGGSVVAADRSVRQADIHIDDGRITKVAPDLDPVGPDTVVLDAANLTVGAGWIDLQVNGGYGIDLASNPEGIAHLATKLARHGVTSWLPTLVSTDHRTRRRFCDAVLAAGTTTQSTNPASSRCVGAHLEGPILSDGYAGAHQLTDVPNLKALVAELDAAPMVSLITVAPEHPRATGLMAAAAERGIVISVGHTGASAFQVHTAADNGATYATHLFNAMAPLHHRSPGPAGAVLADSRFIAGLIADGIHLHDDILRICWSVLGPDRTSLISDATAALGLGPGTHQLAQRAITIDASGTVRTSDGTLAGTSVGLDDCVRNLTRIGNAPIGEVLATVTSTPAKLLRLADRGRVECGLLGDLTLLDHHNRVAATIIGGTCAYVADPSIITRGSPQQTWK